MVKQGCRFNLNSTICKRCEKLGSGEQCIIPPPSKPQTCASQSNSINSTANGSGRANIMQDSSTSKKPMTQKHSNSDTVHPVKPIQAIKPSSCTFLPNCTPLLLALLLRLMMMLSLRQTLWLQVLMSLHFLHWVSLPVIAMMMKEMKTWEWRMWKSRLTLKSRVAVEAVRTSWAWTCTLHSPVKDSPNHIQPESQWKVHWQRQDLWNLVAWRWVCRI